MKIFYADSNIFIRYILQDNKKQAEQSENYFLRAKKQKITIYFLTEIILEIEYVLRKVYKLSRQEISHYISSLIKMTYLEIQDRKEFIIALEIYQKKSMDLVDILLFLKSQEKNAEVLSFDRDFAKLKKLK